MQKGPIYRGATMENRRWAEGAALEAEYQLISRLAEHISARLKTSARAQVLKTADPYKLAVNTLDILFHSIATDRGNTAMVLAIGRAAQAEIWAAGLPSKKRRRIEAKTSRRDRAIAAYRAGYRNEWSEEQAARVGNDLLDYCLQALPEVFYERRRTRRENGRFVREIVIYIRPEAFADALRDRVMGS